MLAFYSQWGFPWRAGWRGKEEKGEPYRSSEYRSCTITARSFVLELVSPLFPYLLALGNSFLYHKDHINPSSTQLHEGDKAKLWQLTLHPQNSHSTYYFHFWADLSIFMYFLSPQLDYTIYGYIKIYIYTLKKKLNDNSISYSLTLSQYLLVALSWYKLIQHSTQQIILEAYSVLHIVLSTRNSPGKAYTHMRQEVIPLLN